MWGRKRFSNQGLLAKSPSPTRQQDALWLRYGSVNASFRDSRLFMARSLVALVIVMLLILLLLARLVHLQLTDYALYRTRAEGNRVKLMAIVPVRGSIFDRNGILLAGNRLRHLLEIVPEQTEDLEATIARLGQLISLSESELKTFHRLRKRKKAFLATPLKYRLSEQEVARFAVQRHTFPGVDLRVRLERYYPTGALSAHLVGYVGRIDEQALKRINQAEYRGTTHIGKSGVERTYEQELHGYVGIQQVEVEVGGRVVRVLHRTPAVAGGDLHLHIDVRLQEVANNALGDFNGAVVMIHIADGGVLAMSSQPSFDNNLFVNGISVQNYRRLQDAKERPLFDRALLGQYPPGSTVKPFISLVGMERDVISRREKVYCKGYYTLPKHSHRYRDWKKSGHGAMAMKNAIAQSCDVYFYMLARSLGIDRIHQDLSAFGFGRATGIDLRGERTGLLPSRAWKTRVKKVPWYPGDTLITGIGQGFMLSTPLQLAAATATLARFGKELPPHVVAAVRAAGQDKAEPLPLQPIQRVPVANIVNWNSVHAAMKRVVHGARGTARRIAKGVSYTIAGKTGTAQVYSIKQNERYNKYTVPEHLKDHALFIAFAPVEAPQVALAVMVEHGGGGSSVAAPIARKVLDVYFKTISDEK